MNRDLQVFKCGNKILHPIETLLALIRQRRPIELARKAYRLWKRSGLEGVWNYIRIFGHITFGYNRWIKQCDALSESSRSTIRTQIAQLQYQPLISILMPTYNAPERWLRRAIESVCAQLYSNWELCIADDASPNLNVQHILEEYSRQDARIKIVFRSCNGHISAASNTALELATGEFCALLDHDDELSETALYAIVASLNLNPKLDLIYSDEDKIDETGRRFAPYFKPDWNPDLLTGQNMVSHLGVFRTALIKQLGGFRLGYEGSQDWDLALRVTDSISPARIHHIPQVLYHWRVIPGSAAGNHEEKPYVVEAAERLLNDHFIRCGERAYARAVFSSYFRPVYALPDPPPKISLVLACRSTTSLLRLLESLRRNAEYPELEIVAVIPEDQPTPARVDKRIFATPNESASLSVCYNLGAQIAEGNLLCFLHDGIAAFEKDWLTELASQAIRPGVGVSGPLLLDSTNFIAHAGWVLGSRCDGNPVAGRIYAGYSASDYGYAGRAGLVQNMTALANDCMMILHSRFDEVGGFNASCFPGWFADIDFCLRLRDRGFRQVWTPFARVKRFESYLPSTPTEEEIQHALEKFNTLISADPAYNPNLTLDEYWPFIARTCLGIANP